MAESNITTGRAKITDSKGNKRFAKPLDLSIFSNQQEQVGTGAFALQSRLPNNPVAQATQPSSATNTGFRVDVPEVVSSRTLSDGVTTQDVLNRRNELEAQANTKPEEIGTVPTTVPTVFDNPENFILSALYGDTPETQASKDVANIRGNITEITGDINRDLSRTERTATQESGFLDKQNALAETNEKIATRTARFRREQRAFLEDATKRGFARGFVEDAQAKLEADATAELADLYIIQNAQSGNLEAARDYINTAVENKYRFIEAELREQQARLEERLPELQGEKEKEALKLQIALSERSSQIAEQKAQDKGKRELLATAAANGASSTVQRQILNAKNLDEASLVAGPYIGLLERQAAQRAASNAALSRRATLVDLALKGDEAARAELGTYGDYLDSIQNDVEKKKRETQFNNAQERIVLAEQIKSNKLGLDLNTGAIKSPTLAALSTLGLSTAAGTGMGGPVGGAVGFGAGAISAGYIYSQGIKAKEDFAADIKALVAPAALQELVDQKEAGATFGALSNAELGLLLAASSQLAGHVNINERTGEVVITGSPEAVQADLDKVISYYEKAKFDTNVSEVDSDSASQINSLYE